MSIGATAVLRSDHDRLRRLLGELAAETDGDRIREQLEDLERQIVVHAALEEELFYPAFRDAAASQRGRPGEERYHELVEEHRLVDLVLPDVKGAIPGSAAFAGRLRVLRDLVERHAAEEEQELFPDAEELLGPLEVVAVGSRMLDLRRELTSSPLPLLQERLRRRAAGLERG